MWFIDYIISFFGGQEEEIETPVDFDEMSSKEKREYRRDQKNKKKDQRRQYRIEKINAVKEKIYAVAAKRKWLFFIIVGAIAAYLIIFKGGFSGGGILDTIKGFF